MIALIGVVLNVRRRWEGFLFWLISNAWWCWHNYKIGEYEQGILFGIFWLLSLYGIYSWKRKESNHSR
ncbi:MAG: nicotinamide mononucleotide transporter [Planctomycetota bacterium]